jgi:hypothetical protein
MAMVVLEIGGSAWTVLMWQVGCCCEYGNERSVLMKCMHLL